MNSIALLTCARGTAAALTATALAWVLGITTPAVAAPSDSPSPDSVTAETEVRGAQGFSLSGTPLAADASGAVTLRPGDWTTHLTDSDTLTWTVTRSQPNSVLRVSVVSIATSDDDQVSLSLSSSAPDSESSWACPDANDSTYNAGLVSVTLTLTPDGDCGDASSYELTLSGSTAPRGSDVMVRVTEEPPVSNSGPAGTVLGSMTGPPTVSGPITPVTGGLSFPDAPALDQGRWSSTLVPGETRVFRVPLTWGQALRTGVTFAPLSENQQDALGTSSPSVRLTLLDPMLGVVPEPDGAETSLSEGEPMFTGTGSVNRGIRANDNTGSTQLAGSYYLVVSVNAVSGESVVLPFSIDLTVLNAPNSGPQWGTESFSVASQVTRPSESSFGGSTRATTQKSHLTNYASGALGGLLILVGVGLLARRRARH